jgi:hypothetical protein
VYELHARDFDVVNFLDGGQSESNLMSPVCEVTSDVKARMRWKGVRLDFYGYSVFAKRRGDGVERP